MSDWGIFPALQQWPAAVNNVAAVEKNVERLRLVSNASNFDQLRYLSNLRDLWCFDISKKQLEIICSCRGLNKLFIDGFKNYSPVCLTKVSTLEVLSLERCSEVEWLNELTVCGNLKGLGIINFKHMHSIQYISELTELRNLAIEGGMMTRMTIDTLEPISNLRKLEVLDLANLKVRDESLRPLGNLQQLRNLNIANFYPMEEFAWLSGRLKNTRCTWFSPYINFEYSPCKKCGRNTMVMLTGKRKPNLCKQCDSARLAKHVAAFEAAASN